MKSLVVFGTICYFITILVRKVVKLLSECAYFQTNQFISLKKETVSEVSLYLINI